MSRFIRFVIDEDGLIDELFAFVGDPAATRNERPVINELHDVAPEMVEVAESMVIDGVDQRRYVADYIHHVFHETMK